MAAARGGAGVPEMGAKKIQPPDLPELTSIPSISSIGFSGSKSWSRALKTGSRPIQAHLVRREGVREVEKGAPGHQNLPIRAD